MELAGQAGLPVNIVSGGSLSVGWLLLAEGSKVAGLVRYQKSAVLVRPVDSAGHEWASGR